MKNIGIVTTWYERGAAYVSRQYLETLQKDNNVFIYARGGYTKDNPEWNQPYVYWGSKHIPPVSMGMNKKDFFHWIKKYNIEIVIFNEQQWWMPVVWCKEKNILTGAYIDYYTEETIPFFAAYDFLLCNSKRHLSAFDWHPQAIYIPWGTNIDLFKPIDGNLKKSDKFTFFHSAGWSPERKGTDLIIKAFYQSNIDATLLIHAQVDIGEKLGLQKIIEELKEKNRLLILDQTVAAPGLYYLGDVYLYPSRLDGLGLTLMEAQACGLPTITIDCPPMNEFVDKSVSQLVAAERYYSRKDGYYWPMNDGDIQGLSEAIRYMYSKKDEIQELKEKTRRYAELNLNWEENSKGLSDKIKKIKKIEIDLILMKRIRSFEYKKSCRYKFIVFIKAFIHFVKNIILGGLFFK